MRKFVKKYIERFKEIKNIIDTSSGDSSGFKAKKGAAFCDGKLLADNYDIRVDAINSLIGWSTGSVGFEYFYDMLGGSDEGFRLATSFWIAENYPDVDSRSYYFQYLDDMSKIDSYPQLPPPSPGLEYGGWLEGNLQSAIGTNQYNSPACVEVPQTFTVDDRAVANPSHHVFNNGAYVPISSYDKPALRNVFWDRGFACVNDLASFSSSVSISAIQAMTNVGWQNWIIQGTQPYPSVLGIMQTTTPYTPYSYKDLLYRLKAHAENPTIPPSPSSLSPSGYNFNITHLTSGYRFQALNYKALFHSIKLTWSPQQVYNHVQKMLNATSVAGGMYTFTPTNYANAGGSIPTGTTYTNWNGAGAFTATTTQAYNRALNNLPTAVGAQLSKGDMEKQIGKISLNRFGFQNCKGCDYGCAWDFKLDKIFCSEHAKAFPFKEQSDCETFTSLYPEYLCEKGVILPDNGEGEEPQGTFNCVTGVCTDPGNGTGVYSSLAACQLNCTPPVITTPYYQCSETLGQCTHTGNTTPLQTPPPNSWPTFSDCEDASDCKGEHWCDGSCCGGCCSRVFSINFQNHYAPQINWSAFHCINKEWDIATTIANTTDPTDHPDTLAEFDIYWQGAWHHVASQKWPYTGFSPAYIGGQHPTIRMQFEHLLAGAKYDRPTWEQGMTFNYPFTGTAGNLLGGSIGIAELPFTTDPDWIANGNVMGGQATYADWSYAIVPHNLNIPAIQNHVYKLRVRLKCKHVPGISTSYICIKGAEDSFYHPTASWLTTYGFVHPEGPPTPYATYAASAPYPSSQAQIDFWRGRVWGVIESSSNNHIIHKWEAVPCGFNQNPCRPAAISDVGSTDPGTPAPDDPTIYG